MCFASAIIYLLSESIILIFSNDLEVIKFGSQYLKIAAFIIPIYPIFFISNAFFTAVKKTYLIFYNNLFRLIILPALIVWSILNIFNGEFQDIFFGLLYMNWIFGFFVLLLVRIVMINKFYEKKKFFFFI